MDILKNIFQLLALVLMLLGTHYLLTGFEIINWSEINDRQQMLSYIGLQVLTVGIWWFQLTIHNSEIDKYKEPKSIRVSRTELQESLGLPTDEEVQEMGNKSQKWDTLKADMNRLPWEPKKPF